MQEPDLLNSPAGEQWKKIGVRHHHGIVIPLFSLHSKNSCGIGEYPDLIPIINWCSELGLDVIQLLPLNDTGIDTSPYSALSAFALNPIHIGLSKLPYLDQDPKLKNNIQELQKLTNQSQRLDYKNIQNKRDAFLQLYFKKYGHFFLSQNTYAAFKQENQYWLKDYAIFKALKISQSWKDWQDWPPEYKNPSEEFFQHPPHQIAQDMEFHSFLQFLCFQQLEEVKKFAERKKIKLKGDIPILISVQSADVWRHKDQFLLDFAAGAPPDMYSQEGQKWGFPLYNWDIIAADNYLWWHERLRVASELYHIYRIDHVVGFFRIWGIPIALEAKFGYFFPSDTNQWIPNGKKLMQEMLKSSPMLPIGEDLGIVPPEVRQCLLQLGICGTKVMRWERNWEGDKSYIDPKNYIAASMTTISTHDSETLQQWWKSQPEEAKLYAALKGWIYSPELTKEQHFDILFSSHHSGSLFHINLLQEYLALIPGMTCPNPEDERINLPGTISDKNWTYRFLPSVEQIVGNAELKTVIKKLTHRV